MFAQAFNAIGKLTVLMDLTALMLIISPFLLVLKMLNLFTGNAIPPLK